MKKTPKTPPWEATVTLNGQPPGIMFDRYLGPDAEVADQDKMYLQTDGSVYIPALNLISFLCSVNSRSAAKALYDSRKYKEKAAALLGNVIITPAEIPITRNGEPVRWTGSFDESPTSGPSGIVLTHHVARLKGGIPNEKRRPLVLAPWEATFQICLFRNRWVPPVELQWLIEEGMRLIGLGTFRGIYGRAAVSWA